MCKVDIITGEVQSIIYQGTQEELVNNGCVLSSGKVLLYSSVVFFCSKTTEVLLDLQARPPLDSCTYLGVDNGAEALHFGLYSGTYIHFTTCFWEK